MLVRPTIRAWLKNVVMPSCVLLTAIGLWAAGYSLDYNVSLFWWAALAVCSVLIGYYALLLPRTWLQLDDTAISGCVNRHPFHIEWAALIAAALEGGKRQPDLRLLTANETYLLPLQFLNAKKVWQQVQSHVPASALEKDAYKRQPAYQAWLASRPQSFPMVGQPLRVCPNALRGIVNHFLPYFLLSLIPGIIEFCFIVQKPVMIPVYLLIPLVTLWLLYSYVSIQMDTETITHVAPMTKYQLKWSDITSIETDYSGYFLIFCVTPNKYLTLPGPIFWSSPDKKQMLDLMRSQIELRDLPVTTVERIIPKVSKGVGIDSMKILFVENHARFARIASQTFLSGHEVVIVPSLKAAREELSQGRFDTALVDYDLDDGKGDDLVTWLQSSANRPRIISISSHARGNEALLAAGADAACGKLQFSGIRKLLGATDTGAQTA